MLLKLDVFDEKARPMHERGVAVAATARC